MTTLADRLGLDFALILAPMAGGPSTPELAAAASQCGALGSLGVAYLEPAAIRSVIEATRALTARPFAVNLFAPAPAPGLDPARVRAAIEATRPYREELGLPEPRVAPPFHPDVRGQLEAVLEARPAALSFVFGLLDRAWLDECRARGILTLGTATTLEEGLALEQSGVNAIVAQGTEAGGHRGTFDARAPEPGVRTLELTRALVSRTRLPIISAGGLMNGRDIALALAAGAQAAQLGTAFLLCPEAGTSAPYRAALAGARETVLTRAFSGRLARGLPNRFARELAGREAELLPFPAQNAFTRDLRGASMRAGSPELLSLWAGAGVASLRPGLSVAEIIQQLRAEAGTGSC